MTRYCQAPSCGKPLPADSRPDKDTCDSRCRGKAWRAQQRINREQLVLQAERPRSGMNARSGRQVSYEKAVREVQVVLEDRFALRFARVVAEETMARALPERQQR